MNFTEIERKFLSTNNYAMSSYTTKPSACINCGVMDCMLYDASHPSTLTCLEEECILCSHRDCPKGCELHYHRDGCAECRTRFCKTSAMEISLDGGVIVSK